MPDPHRPADAESRGTAAAILRGATTCALATLRDGAPSLARVACAWVEGQGLCLILSDLSDHTRDLSSDTSLAVLVGDPEDRGDPLTHARLTLHGRAERIDKAAHRAAVLAARPKAALWYDFADFGLYRVAPAGALLNAGFGRAHRLTPADLP
ncbi:pyridoxamine 5'-phosphate oxidase family protein [Jannaschia sp. Os4]|uniref:pyridoxamine 5'-phosphate oxidase family protein n=1 Tax=Jannaschia sp. Os4 TaxID=2807617 RepID=UPI0019398E6D|nr:pyridoxamine 5'-phosphate oxidase family protein [Jannaschia sp. Os4]MBM2575801.1 pyridoxamine 5'-phosphate oxidase family protein [Jannaschia sp. Os4]